MTRLRGPLVIGGLGGSGSRAIVRVVTELRWFMAPRRNEEQDALDVAEFDYRWTPPFVNGQADVARMHDEFDRDVLPKLLPGGRWGWKHNPSAHLLAFYLERFADLRFIHVMRDGRDVVRNAMGASVHVARLRRALLDGDPTPVGPDHPAWMGEPESDTDDRATNRRRVAACWAATNRAAADVGERMGETRYLRLRLEDVVDDPDAEIRRLARFLGVDDVPAETAKLIIRPTRMGSWKRGDVELPVEAMRTELERFGYLD